MASPETCDLRSLKPLDESLNVAINVAGVLGIAGSCLLLRGLRGWSNSIFQQLVTWLAVADLLGSLWYFVPSWISNHSLLMKPWVTWCGPWLPVLKLLELWSAVLAVNIAWGILFALLKLHRPLELLRFAPLASAPTAALLGLGYLLNLGDFDVVENPVGKACGVEKNFLGYIFGIEMVGMFLLILGVHVFGVVMLWERSPLSSIKRAFGSASSFLVAFLLAWSATVVYLALFWLGGWARETTLPCGVYATQSLVLPALQDIGCALSGLFNFFAFRRLGLKQTRVVLFLEPDLDCPDVAANGSPQEAEEEVWRIFVEPASSQQQRLRTGGPGSSGLLTFSFQSPSLTSSEEDRGSSGSRRPASELPRLDE